MNVTIRLLNEDERFAVITVSDTAHQIIVSYLIDGD